MCRGLSCHISSLDAELFVFTDLKLELLTRLQMSAFFLSKILLNLQFNALSN